MITYNVSKDLKNRVGRRHSSLSSLYRPQHATTAINGQERPVMNALRDNYTHEISHIHVFLTTNYQLRHLIYRHTHSL